MDVGESMSSSLEVLKYKKSNELISAKYKASTLENQLIAIALSRLEEQYDDKGLLCFEAEIYPNEIRQLIKDDDHIYRDLKKVAKKMINRPICIEDDKGNFNFFQLIPNAEYKNRVFKISFNKALKRHIYELSEKYTTLQLSMVTELKDWSFRIYEVLKKDYGYYSTKNHTTSCQVEYRISEFRFMIGLANIEDDSIRDKLKNNPDWDELYELLPKKEKKYTRINDFRKNVLDIAKADLENKSDLVFTYELIAEGRFQKRIKFTIESQELKATDTILQKQRIIKKGMKQLIIPSDMPQFRVFYDKYEGDDDFQFGKDDLTLFLERAAFNIGIVEEAIEVARKQPNLKNFMGWILSYIDKGGYVDRPSIYGNAEKGQIISDFKEEYEAGKKDGSVQKSAWESLLKRSNFQDFEDFLDREYGWDAQMIVDVYGHEKAVKVFMDWNRGREVKI